MSSYLQDCANKAFMVFSSYGCTKEKSIQLVKDTLDLMETISNNFSVHHIAELKQFNFDLTKMNQKQRRSILFQLALCGVLRNNGLA